MDMTTSYKKTKKKQTNKQAKKPQKFRIFKLLIGHQQQPLVSLMIAVILGLLLIQEDH